MSLWKKIMFATWARVFAHDKQPFHALVALRHEKYQSALVPLGQTERICTLASLVCKIHSREQKPLFRPCCKNYYFLPSRNSIKNGIRFGACRCEFYALAMLGHRITISHTRFARTGNEIRTLAIARERKSRKHQKARIPFLIQNILFSFQVASAFSSFNKILLLLFFYAFDTTSDFPTYRISFRTTQAKAINKQTNNQYLAN